VNDFMKYAVSQKIIKIDTKDFGLHIVFHSSSNRTGGGVVVEALRYKPEGRGIDSRWCHWNFSLR
jgi:hypothetical protein